ncbi:hypothetical protein AAC387_Pa03g0924 [Persea americana]
MKFKDTILEDPKGITKTWMGGDPCKFKGFHCAVPPDDKSSNALAAVDFNGFKLRAPSVKGFIDQLPDLAFFHANSNKFGGPVPSSLARLPYFYELDISNNHFTGSFPTEVLKLKNLTFLDIRFNSFEGVVPQELFFSFKLLEVLFINNNMLMQPLPSNLGQTPVKYLTLANNQFTGSIPRSIGQAKNTLIEVLFLNNKLSGCLPYEIGYLQKATVFDAGFNRITGPIPFSFGCLYKVEQLNLAGNLLYGQIPEVVCKLGNLLNLSLSDNYFTAVGPLCRKLIKKGRLDAKKNCVLGLPNQRKPEDCTRFYSRAMHWQCPVPKQMYSHLPCEGKYDARAVSSPFSSVVSPTAAPPSYSALIHNR